MEKQPLIKQGWLRVLLFVLVYQAIIIFIVFASGFIVSALSNTEMKNASTGELQEMQSGKFLVTGLFLSFLTSVIAVFAFRKLLDKQPVSSLGLSLKNHKSHAATGFFLGILLLGIGSIILIVNKNLQWTDFAFDGKQLFLSFGLMIFVAVAEELVFRGYILNNLLQSLNKWLALILSALLFALFHRTNPAISPLALFNIFLGGLILGVNYIYTKNLWFGIFLHFSWNFYQGSILGYKVSGLNLQSLLQQELTGKPWLTGAGFGFEGSVIDTGISIVGFLLLAWIYEKKSAAAPVLPDPHIIQ